MFSFRGSLALLISAAVFADCSRIPPNKDEEEVNDNEDRSQKVVGDSTMKMFRLPEHTKPILYRLSMVPNLSGKFTFTGSVQIEIEAKTRTKSVHLHSSGLNITGASVSVGHRHFRTEVVLEPQNEILILKTKNTLVTKHRYLLNMTFEGFLNDDMLGFYRSYYKIGNVTKWLATTQFEPTHARYAFPCYDEPGFKTPFHISVARLQTQKAISNMPLKSTSLPDPTIDNRVRDYFAPTPPMPTYLVAFMVFEFSSLADEAKTFSVWTRENAIGDASYILHEGPKLLKQMGVYTGIPYSLPKMDLVAVPDFDAGAMENWGLTTYREKIITYNPKVCPTSSLEVSTTVVAHEFAHQWFGDYVTPTWWDYVWLNEAFATYFEYHITAEVEPTWRLNEYFLVDVMQLALFVDEAGVHHAMTTPVKTPAEIESIFDSISYSKGGSVLRMLEHIVTSANYKEALHIYLTKGYQSGGSVTPDNLWSAFEQQIHDKQVHLPEGMNITTIMGNWTNNRGYPLIKIARHTNGNMVDIIIEQETYSTPRAGTATPDQGWPTPLTCTKQTTANFTATEPSFWSLPRERSTLKNEVEQNEWILCNIQQTGYYRVQYDDENWKLLIKQLRSNHGVIHPLNRAQLIDDCCCLAVDHKLPFLTSLELLKYLRYETDPIPLTSALTNLHYLFKKYGSTLGGPTLKNYIIKLIEPVYNRFGFNTKPTDDHRTKTLRSNLVAFACALQIEKCLTAAKDEYANNKNDLRGINPEVKQVVLCTMLNTESKETVWRDMWTLYRKSNMAWEVETILRSFGCTPDIALLKTLLYKLIDENDTEIRPQNYYHVFRPVFASSNGVMACLKLVDDLLPKFGNMSSDSVKMVQRLLRWVPGRVNTEELVKTVDELIFKVEKLDQNLYEKVLAKLRRARESANKRNKYDTMTRQKLNLALESLTDSTTTSTTTFNPPTNTTTKPSSASNVLPAVLVSVFASSLLLCFR